MFQVPVTTILLNPRQIQIQKARTRLTAIDKIITNLYTDNCSLFLIINLKKPALFYLCFPDISSKNYPTCI